LPISVSISSCVSEFGSSLFHCYRARPHLPSFPTRRSSDLQRPEAGTEVEVAHARLGAVAVGHVDVGDVLGRLANRGRDVGLLDVDRKSTRLNSSHVKISYAVFCLKKKKKYPSISFSSSHIQ